MRAAASALDLGGQVAFMLLLLFVLAAPPVLAASSSGSSSVTAIAYTLTLAETFQIVAPRTTGSEDLTTTNGTVSTVSTMDPSVLAAEIFPSFIPPSSSTVSPRPSDIEVSLAPNPMPEFIPAPRNPFAFLVNTTFPSTQPNSTTAEISGYVPSPTGIAQAKYFRNVSGDDAWLYQPRPSRSLTKVKRDLGCECFDPASKCCQTGSDGLFCVPGNGTCCANTYCLPGEQCCGNGCCPADTDCQPLLSSCCKKNTTCSIPPICLNSTSYNCTGSGLDAIAAMQCCPASLPFCLSVSEPGIGCYAATLSSTTPSSTDSGLHGTTTVTITPSVATGAYVATATPATTFACTIYTTLQSTVAPASASGSAAASTSSTSALCFDPVMLSATPCTPTITSVTTIYPTITVYSSPTSASQLGGYPGAVTLGSEASKMRNSIWVLMAVEGVFAWALMRERWMFPVDI